MNVDTTIPLRSNFFTNREGNTLMKEFEGILTNNPQVKNLDAVVGFLRASGYITLRPFLDGIAFCGVPIVSNTLDKKYGKTQVPVEGGLYVMTHSSTHDKKKMLDKIAIRLGVKLKVEEI